MRRSALLAAGGFGAFFPGEDVELWIKLALYYPIAASDARTAYYVKDTGGLMDQRQLGTRWVFGLPPHLQALERLFDPARHASLARSIAAYRAHYFRLSVRQSIYRGRPDVARQFIALLHENGDSVSRLDWLLVRLPASLVQSVWRMRNRVREAIRRPQHHGRSS